MKLSVIRIGSLFALAAAAVVDAGVLRGESKPEKRANRRRSLGQNMKAKDPPNRKPQKDFGPKSGDAKKNELAKKHDAAKKPGAAKKLGHGFGLPHKDESFKMKGSGNGKMRV